MDNTQNPNKNSLGSQMLRNQARPIGQTQATQPNAQPNPKPAAHSHGSKKKGGCNCG